MPDAAPITVTGVLQSVFDDVGEPLLVTAIGAGAALIPGVGPILSSAWLWVMKIPLMSGWLKKVVDQLIANGVIDIKIGILKYLSSKAREKWAPEVTLLEQYNAEGKTMSPEENAAYDSALQDLVKNRPGLVRA